MRKLRAVKPMNKKIRMDGATSKQAEFLLVVGI